MQWLEQVVVESIEFIVLLVQYVDWCVVWWKVGVFGCVWYGVCCIMLDFLFYILVLRNCVVLMKIFRCLELLIEDGLIDEVVCLLMSGKEVLVYVVCCGDSLCCVKVYKEVNKCSFCQVVEYQEGCKVCNSCQVWVMVKGLKYGCCEQEEVWQNVEVVVLFCFVGVGVWVLKFYDFFDGVLLMELVVDVDGDVVLCFNDVMLEFDEVWCYYVFLICQIVVMFCVGLVYGDFFEFNVLFGLDGLVIIDLLQVVDVVGNNYVFSMFECDVGNMVVYFGCFVLEFRQICYVKEMWVFYEVGELIVEILFSGIFVEVEEVVDVCVVFCEIEVVQCEEVCCQVLCQVDDVLCGECEELLLFWLQ